MRYLFALGLVLMAPQFAQARPASWSLARPGIDETAYVSVSADATDPLHVLAASSSAVYETTDGSTWRERLRVPAGSLIRHLAYHPAGLLLVATDSGLIVSRDGETSWRLIHPGMQDGAADCLYSAISETDPTQALAGTASGLFHSRDAGLSWQIVAGLSGEIPVHSVAFDPHDTSVFYAVADDGIHSGDLNKGTLRKLRGALRAEVVAAEGSDGSEGEAPPLPHLSALILDPEVSGTLYAAFGEGIDVSRDFGNTWHPLPTIGLPGTGISRLLLIRRSPPVLYAATSNGVAYLSPADPQWTHLGSGLAQGPIHDLAATGKEIWAAADDGLLRVSLGDPVFPEPEVPSAKDLLSNFVHEPTIRQVQEEAIDYAEVHPEKIKRWRAQAAISALLPSLDFGYDRDDDLWIASRGSTTDPDTDRIFTRENPSSGIDFSVTWNLGELIWNPDQTAIDVRSKLMVQLRDDIVDEVTRAYFERRRLQVELLTRPPKTSQEIFEKELRIQELTALLDGLTGGYFSDATNLQPGKKEAQWRKVEVVSR